jgi:hypothetical protein
MGELTAAQALRIALEDGQTAHFIQTAFSKVEQRPQILTAKWRLRIQDRKAWAVAIVETCRHPAGRCGDLINAAILAVDLTEGSIQDRKYFKNIFFSEFQKKLRRELGVRLGGCRGRPR